MNTTRIMSWVLAALVPGLTTMTLFYGFGVLWNVLILSACCLLVEALALSLRGRRFAELKDGSALLTAWLIATCLPPNVPFTGLLLASLGAIALAKHAYGGIGRNIFNPAMVGYALLLVSFPESLATWPALSEASTDALSGATLLTEFHFREGLTTTEFYATFAQAIQQQHVIAGAFLLGGLALVYQKLVAWRIPASMLFAVLLCSLFGYDQGSSASLGSLWFHASAGGFVIAAFFIASDPVTHPRQPLAQFIFGFAIGAMIYFVRGFGTFPDGIAFAILFGNCLTPLLNRIAARQVFKATADV